MRTRLGYLLLALGLLILVLFISSLNLSRLAESVKEMDVSLFALAFLMLVLNILIKGYRWKIIVKRVTGIDILLGFSNISILAGVSAGSIVPGRGDIAKPLMLKNTYGASLASSIAGMIVERVLDIIALFSLFLISMPLLPLHSSLASASLAWLPVFLILLAAPVVLHKKIVALSRHLLRFMHISDSTREKILSSIDTFLSGFSVLRSRAGIMLLLISFVAMVLEAARLFFIFKSLRLDVDIMGAAFGFTASVLIGLLTFIPGGVGVTEFSESAIINELYHTPEGLIKNAVLLDRVLSYYLLIVAGAVVLMLHRKKNT